MNDYLLSVLVGVVIFILFQLNESIAILVGPLLIALSIIIMLFNEEEDD